MPPARLQTSPRQDTATMETKPSVCHRHRAEHRRHGFEAAFEGMPSPRTTSMAMSCPGHTTSRNMVVRCSMPTVRRTAGDTTEQRVGASSAAGGSVRIDGHVASCRHANCSLVRHERTLAATPLRHPAARREPARNRARTRSPSAARPSQHARLGHRRRSQLGVLSRQRPARLRPLTPRSPTHSAPPTTMIFSPGPRHPQTPPIFPSIPAPKARETP
jgi:hypothetical protein